MMNLGAFLNDTGMPPQFDYNNPSVQFEINGVVDPQSIRFHVCTHSICSLSVGPF